MRLSRSTPPASPRRARPAAPVPWGLLLSAVLMAGCAAPTPEEPGELEWVRRGQQLLQPERATQASAAFARALAQEPSSLPALLGRAQAEVWAGEADAALSDLTLALTQRPLARAHWLRGTLWFGRQDFARAAKDFERACLLAPREAPLYVAWAQAKLRLGDAAAALRGADEALRLAPDEPEVRAVRGAILLKLHRYTESSAELTRALEARASGQSYELRGDAFFAQGEHQAAVVDYTEVLRRDAASLCRVARGLCFLELDRHNDAERDFSRWLDAHPQDARVLLWRGVSRAQRQAWGLAEADLARARELAEDEALRAQIDEQRRLVEQQRRQVW
ncbi:MAG: tetratricopeptide repeat protein [Planctomycetota bacterium]